ncbi:Mesothelin-like protein [Galemys pyrenaicus]|uniref:Mesothelin-like protein n=1 Tax=Galemys pyrenaicus TaxID=202257 RepID=A0A8J6DG32_GALPY|nr:Mesothelin-like protein [Galemys pyrenaicus]
MGPWAGEDPSRLHRSSSSPAPSRAQGLQASEGRRCWTPPGRPLPAAVLAGPGLALLLALAAHCAVPQAQGPPQGELDAGRADLWARANASLLRGFWCLPASHLSRDQLSALIRRMASEQVSLGAWQAEGLQGGVPDLLLTPLGPLWLSALRAVPGSACNGPWPIQPIQPALQVRGTAQAECPGSEAAEGEGMWGMGGATGRSEAPQQGSREDPNREGAAAPRDSSSGSGCPLRPLSHADAPKPAPAHHRPRLKHSGRGSGPCARQAEGRPREGPGGPGRHEGGCHGLDLSRGCPPPAVGPWPRAAGGYSHPAAPSQASSAWPSPPARALALL